MGSVVTEDDCEFCGGPVNSVQLEAIIQKATKATKATKAIKATQAGDECLVRDDRKRT